MKQLNLADTIAATSCPGEVECDPAARYRSHDGTCNHLERSRLGSRDTPFQRIRDTSTDFSWADKSKVQKQVRVRTGVAQHF